MNLGSGEVILIAALFGTLAAVVALRKGRSAPGFFLLGVLLPVVGLLLALLARPHRPSAV